jgi:Super-infection exclusion protein B
VLALPVAIIAVLLFGSLSVAAIGAIIADAIKQRRKTTLLAQRRQIRRSEAEQAQAEYEARVLACLDYLSTKEIAYIADALRKNEQSFTAFSNSPYVSNLMARGIVATPGGTHHQDYYPFYFVDFAWKALLARKDEFIAKDDEHKRREAAEAKRRRTLRGY